MWSRNVSARLKPTHSSHKRVQQGKMICTYNAPSAARSTLIRLYSANIASTRNVTTENARKITHTLQKMTEKLASLKSVTEPRLEASILMSVALNEPRDALITNYNRILSETESQRIDEVLLERLKEKPVPYISGVKEFYGRQFSVSSDTLIPRPATETLVSETLDAISEYFSEVPSTPTESAISSQIAETPPFQLLELGVGSGCVIVSLISELNSKPSKISVVSGLTTVSPSSKSSPHSSASSVNARWRGTGVDQSKGALKISGQNARAHSVDHLIQFFESNWTEDLVGRHGVKTKWDVVVTNPPYLTNFDWENAPSIMRDFEPSSAFVGGPDGLDCYRDIHRQLPPILKPGSLVCLEIGAWQAEQVVEIFHPDFSLIKQAKDMDGHMRVLIMKFKGTHPNAQL